MNNLDSTDFWQIVSIVVALVLGFLPSLKPVKGINFYSVGLVFLFIVAVSTAVSTTISKSISDKENYTNLVYGSESTLQRVNQNLDASETIMNNTNESIERLQDLQSNSIELQRQNLALQKSSELLNQQLKSELEIQKAINKAANKLVENDTKEGKKRNGYEHLQLLSGMVEILNSKAILYDGVRLITQKADSIIRVVYSHQINYNNLNDSLKNLGREITKKEYDYLQTLLSQWNLSYKEFSNKYGDFIVIPALSDSGTQIYFRIDDSLTLVNSIREFINYNINAMTNNISNPTLYKDSLFFQKWQARAIDLTVKKQQFYHENNYKRRLILFSQLIYSHYQFGLVLREKIAKFNAPEVIIE